MSENLKNFEEEKQNVETDISKLVNNGSLIMSEEIEAESSIQIETFAKVNKNSRLEKHIWQKSLYLEEAAGELL